MFLGVCRGSGAYKSLTFCYIYLRHILVQQIRLCPHEDGSISCYSLEHSVADKFAKMCVNSSFIVGNMNKSCFSTDCNVLISCKIYTKTH